MIQPVQWFQRFPRVVLVSLFMHAVVGFQAAGWAQAVRGVVLDDQDLTPVNGALVQLLIDGSITVSRETDTDGHFMLPAPGAGDYQLDVARIGYRASRSQSFRLEAGDTLDVEFTVRADAVLLDPITITGRSNLGRNLFDRRRTDWGRGVFLTPGQIDSMSPRHPADVFHGIENIDLRWDWGELSSGASGSIPTIRARVGRGCLLYMVDRNRVVPAPWVRGSDWADAKLSGLMPEDVVAVEIYRSVLEVPPELRRHTSQSRLQIDAGNPDQPRGKRELVNCGLVILWTRAGW